MRHHFNSSNGIAILIVPLITASLLIIGVGIFNFVVTELKISGELGTSFRALYAADEGIDLSLYNDRVLGQYPDAGTYTIPAAVTPTGACYNSTIIKTAAPTTEITVIGYVTATSANCAVSRLMQRSFRVFY